MALKISSLARNAIHNQNEHFKLVALVNLRTIQRLAQKTAMAFFELYIIATLRHHFMGEGNFDDFKI